MDIKHEMVLDSVTSDGCFSIRKQNYIDINGQRADVGLPERRAFCPGEFDDLQDYVPEFEVVAKALWTPEVIAAWERKQLEEQARM